MTPNTITVARRRWPLAETALPGPYETSIGSRMDLGFDMTKANGIRQLSAGTNIAYTGERSTARVGMQALFNRQTNAPRTRRWEMLPEYRYLFSRSWYAPGTATFFSSEEQKLDLSSSFGGGVGVAWTRERYSDPAVSLENSEEAFVSAEYMTKRLKVADLLARFNLFPKLTDSGAIR